jgi:hypothetical protein
MVINPLIGPVVVEKQISDDWEAAKEGETLLECLIEVVDNYAQFINGEIGWDEKRKLLALAAEVELRIRPKRY